MKKIVLVLVLVLVSFPAFAQQRSAESALSVAEQFMSTPNARQITGNVDGNPQLHLMLTGQDNAYYLFTTDESKGFVLVSGDERMQSILGYSYASPVSTDKMPDNFKFWLSLYEEEYKAIKSSVSYPVRQKVQKANSNQSVDALVTSKWNQSEPYYNDCPTYNGSTCLTGCAATATAQVMNYFKYPECGTGTVSYTTSTDRISISEDLSQHPFDWDNMCNTYSGSETAAQKAAVANLCYMCGVAEYMDYDPSGSGSNYFYQIDALYNNFGYDTDMALYIYDSYNASDWDDLIQDELLAGRPLLYSGWGSGYSNGHAFILDGYKYENDTPYYHFNWGWGGYCDDYFTIPNLSAGGYDFTTGMLFIGGIQPEDNVQTLNSLFEGDCSLSQKTMLKDDINEVTATVSLYNYSQRSFTGNVNFRLLKPDGTSTDLTSYSFSDLAYRTGYSNLSVSFTPDAVNGVYTLQAFSKASGSDTEEKVHIGNNVTLTVSDELAEVVDSLQATSITINQTSCTDTQLNVSLSEVLNLGTDSYTGTVSLMVADDNGNETYLSGDAASVSGLGHYYCYSDALTVTGDIPSNLADGHYTLYAVSKRNTNKNYYKLYKWIHEGNYITDTFQDLQAEFWIKDGAISFTGTDYIDVTFTVGSGGSVVVNDETFSAGTHNVSVIEGATLNMTFQKESGMQLSSVKIDGTEVIDNIFDLTYSTTAASGMVVTVAFDTAIDFANTITMTFDSDNTSVVEADGYKYGSGSLLVYQIGNSSGMTIRETGICLAEGADGTKTSNMISGTTYTLYDGYVRTWKITLGGNFNDPYIFETISARGQEYVFSCSPSVVSDIARPAGISATPLEVFSVDGKRQADNTLHRGLNIVRMSDGSVRKILR